ncbi:MAG: 23S rRNA (pseudouridine(1915)-N(3))-methyltransferase RlmH [Alphaproteobacteria bacterium]|nr:23S rRNA (pseudouridine(1915)-N(3))-methyltransferase RlmH [Alphaproteobacteria bacterium]
MKLTVVAIGQKVPDWAQTAWDDYAKRFPAEIKFQIKALRTEPRGSKSVAALMAAERERIESACGKGSYRVVLDERGDRMRTLDLAERLKQWQGLGQEVCLVIGGPDGLDPGLRDQAHERVRLSDLTLPHAMVRVLLVEQLYRAWSVLAQHPYHRE